MAETTPEGDPVPADRAALLEQLTDLLPPGAVVTDPDVLLGYRHDQARWAEAGTPLALVRPGSTAEVATVLRLASEHRVPVVPRGAGSGLAGGANATDGALTLSLARMNRILEVDRQGMYAVVQPGVVNAELRRAVAAEGLWYPPDPSSYEMCTIGGNLATNAGGLCCVKYGVTREAVLGLEAVLADGSVVRAGGRTVKNVAGYDVVGLFVGSEGTLGVITEATLRLRPAPEPGSVVVAFFPSLPAAGRAVSDIVASTRPALLELMDRTTVAAVEDWKRMDLDTSAAALLLARTDSDSSGGEADRIAALCEANEASLVVRSTDEIEAELLVTARRLAIPALEQRGATLLDDVAVPLSRIAELFAAVERIADRYGVLIGTFGHAGDGNMHPTVVFDPDDPDAGRRAREAFDAIVVAALELGGTLTGEHGVGVLKRAHLAAALDPATLRLHHAIKDALDPLGILNPGKVL